MPALLKRAVVVLVSGFLGLALVETGILLVFRYPSLLPRAPSALSRHLKNLYQENDQSVIQLEPRFARFDEGLFYTLKPGRFTFSNREFSVGFDVNPLGVRDDDLSLRAPEIVVLGDSYAMGWGVEQHEAFASVLEVQTGHTVLNAGVSSYGTPRELRMLDRIDTSRLRTLVIQYCVNDAGENLSFERHGNRLVVDGPAKYDEVVSGYQNAKRYFFWPSRSKTALDEPLSTTRR